MDFNEFRLESNHRNNNKRNISNDNMKQVYKSEVETEGEKKLFNLFNVNDDDILDNNELKALRQKISNYVKRNNNSVFDKSEAEAFLLDLAFDGDFAFVKGKNDIKDVSSDDLYGLLGLSIDREDNTQISEIKVQTPEEFVKLDTASSDGIIPTINDILDNNEYIRTKDSNGNITVKNKNGEEIAFIRPKFASVEIYGETSGNVRRSVSYYYNGELDYKAEYDISSRTTTRYYEDKIEEVKSDIIKTYKIIHDADGNSVKGAIVSEATFLPNGDEIIKNYEEGKIFHHEQNSRICHVYDLETKELLYTINTTWVDGKPVQRIVKKDNQIIDTENINNPHFNRNYTHAELLQMRDSVLTQICSCIENAIGILKNYQNNMGFWDIEWDGLKVLSKPIGYLINDVPKTVQDMIDYYEDLLTKVKKLSSTSVNFDSEFQAVMGVKFDINGAKELTDISTELDNQYALKTIDNTISNVISSNVAEWKNSYILAFSLIYGREEALSKVQLIINLYGEQYAKERLTTELKEIQLNLKNKMKSDAEIQHLEEKCKTAYKKCFGISSSENADKYVEMCGYGSIAMEVIFTVATAGALTEVAGCNQAAEYFVSRYGTYIGGILAKAAPTVIMSQTPIAIDSTYRLFAGNFNSEETFTRMWQGLMYGGFGAYISGPAGELVKNVARTFQSNSGKIVNIMNGIFGAATETTLDVIFDRLTSDLSLEESLGQNGIMNYAMMFLGGDINRQYNKAELNAARKRAKNIKIQKNDDGTFNVKDETNGKTIHIKDNADLLCFLVTGKSMFEHGIQRRSSNDVSNGTNQHQVHNNQPAQSSEVTIHPENNKPENNTVSKEFKNKISELEQKLKNDLDFPNDKIDLVLNACKCMQDINFINSLFRSSGPAKSKFKNIEVLETGVYRVEFESRIYTYKYENNLMRVIKKEDIDKRSYAEKRKYLENTINTRDDAADILKFVDESNIDFILRVCEDYDCSLFAQLLISRYASQGKEFATFLEVLILDKVSLDYDKVNNENINLLKQLYNDPNFDNENLFKVVNRSKNEFNFIEEIYEDLVFGNKSEYEYFISFIGNLTNKNVSLAKELYNDKVPINMISRIIAECQYSQKIADDISTLFKNLDIDKKQVFLIKRSAIENRFIVHAKIDGKYSSIEYELIDGKAKRVATNTSITKNRNIDRKVINTEDGGKIVGESTNDGGYRKTVYDSEGRQVYSEVLSPTDVPGEYKLNLYERGKNGGYKKQEAGTITVSDDGVTKTVIRKLKSGDGTITYQKKIEGPDSSSSEYKIIDKNGNVIFEQVREHRKVKENYYESTIDGKKYIAEFKSDGSNEIVISKIDDNGNVQTVTLTLDKSLIDLYKKLPIDILFNIHQMGISIELKNNAGNSSYLNGKIIIEPASKNDPFILIHEYGHAMDDLVFNRLSEKPEFIKIYEEEYKAFTLNSTNAEKNAIDYFISANPLFTDFLNARNNTNKQRRHAETFAESVAILSGSFVDGNLLGSRSIILQHHFPKTFVYIANAMKNSIAYKK